MSQTPAGKSIGLYALNPLPRDRCRTSGATKIQTKEYRMTFHMLLCLVIALVLPGLVFAAAPNTMRVAGNFSFNVMHVEQVERPFFNTLAEKSGIDLKVTYNPMDVVNVQAADALRTLRSGTFDVMSVQIGMASRDDPFLEGLDLIGVSTNLKDLRVAVDAYRDVFDKRLQQRFNAKVLTLWPFGPQVFFSNKPLTGITDFKGLKIRSFTPSMAALLQHFGATPVTMQFSEVYTALQRGVVDAGVTAPVAGNTANWPEVTTHQYPLAVSGSVQGHFVNLNYWNRFSPETQKKLLTHFKQMEDAMWSLSGSVNDDAVLCNTGQADCQNAKKFSMVLVPVSPEDSAKVHAAVNEVVLPLWKNACDKVFPEGSSIWNETVGKARGFTIK